MKRLFTAIVMLCALKAIGQTNGLPPNSIYLAPGIYGNKDKTETDKNLDRIMSGRVTTSCTCSLNDVLINGNQSNIPLQITDFVLAYTTINPASITVDNGTNNTANNPDGFFCYNGTSFQGAITHPGDNTGLRVFFKCNTTSNYTDLQAAPALSGTNIHWLDDDSGMVMINHVGHYFGTTPLTTYITIPYGFTLPFVPSMVIPIPRNAVAAEMWQGAQGYVYTMTTTAFAIRFNTALSGSFAFDFQIIK